jgi:rRNA maturation protein Nop10
MSYDKRVIEMAANYAKNLYKDYEKIVVKNETLTVENQILKKEHLLLRQEIRLRKKLEETVSEKEKEIEALKKEILRLNGFLNTDGSNSGIPTSKTPLHKNKRIPNAREKSNRHIGGQPGHPRSKLEGFAQEEITEHVKHPPEACPNCGGELKPLEECVEKDELDYEVVVVKKRHHFLTYRCKECGKACHQAIPENLKMENQYGCGAKSLMLLLMNTGNVSVNKVQKMIYGLSQQEMNPGEGFIIKQQKKGGRPAAGLYGRTAAGSTAAKSPVPG